MHFSACRFLHGHLTVPATRVRPPKFRLTIVLAIIVLICVVMDAYGAEPATRFAIYDALRFNSKPDLRAYGIPPIRIIYAAQIWPGKKHMEEPPSRERLEDIASSTVRTRSRWGDLVVLDVEHWPLRGASQTVSRNMSRYLRLLDSFRALAPGIRFGYYGTVPIVDFARATRPGSRVHATWRAENAVLRPLAADVDALFPSLYARNDDVDAWVRYAQAQLAEARRYANGKPVYAFLMPQYHPVAKKPPEALIEDSFWRTQLETCARLADGVVLWGGKNLRTRKPMRWDEDAAWWRITKDFTAAH